MTAAATEAAGLPSQSLSLTLSYNGAGFHGFARQPSLPTVQGALEEALATVFKREVLTVAAGRTDAGVHALGQVVSFELTPDELAARPLQSLRNSLNALTPESVVVRSIDQRPAGFSARFDAREREYRYRLVASETPPLFLAPYTWWLPSRSLDVNLMRQTAQVLVGEHDFKSFCVAKPDVEQNTVRELRSLMVFEAEHLGELSTVLQVIGNAFLHSMVRVITGSLVEVGLGRRQPEWLAEALAARDRRAAGPTAPAQGLTLWRVRY